MTATVAVCPVESVMALGLSVIAVPVELDPTVTGRVLQPPRYEQTVSVVEPLVMPYKVSADPVIFGCTMPGDEIDEM